MPSTRTGTCKSVSDLPEDSDALRSVVQRDVLQIFTAVRKFENNELLKFTLIQK